MYLALFDRIYQEVKNSRRDSMRLVIHPNKVYFSKDICDLLNEDRVLRYKENEGQIILLPKSTDNRIKSIKVTITKSGIGITNRKTFYELLNKRLVKVLPGHKKYYLEGLVTENGDIIFDYSKATTDISQDLSGQRFGRLLVIKKTGMKKAYSPYYECICDCGTTRDDILAVYLTSGDIKSCGCLKKERNSSQVAWGSLGIKGVSVDRKSGRFRANIFVDGEQVLFRRRKKLKEAILDRKIAEVFVSNEVSTGNYLTVATKETVKEISDKIQRVRFIKAIQGTNIEEYDNETIKKVYDLLFLNQIPS